jgi:hypothetical protein
MSTTKTRRRLVRASVALATVGSTLVIAPPAFAHEPRSFDSCAAYRRHGGYCGDTASYLYGDRVFLRATVDPPHGHQEANAVLRPGADRWRQALRFRSAAWAECSGRSLDARRLNQTEPWLFRFRIADRSQATPPRCSSSASDPLSRASPQSDALIVSMFWPTVS